LGRNLKSYRKILRKVTWNNPEDEDWGCAKAQALAVEGGKEEGMLIKNC
jgi:hypothetical protein